MLVGGVTDPVDSGIVSDGLVHRINHDALIPLVHGILGNPVRVEDSERSQLTTNTLLSNGSKVSGSLDSGDTGGGGFSVADTLGHLALTRSTLDTDTVNQETLFGFVTKTASFVRSAGSASPVDGRELTILPSPDTRQKSHDIALLLLPEFFKILVGTHCGELFLQK